MPSINELWIIREFIIIYGESIIASWHKVKAAEKESRKVKSYSGWSSFFFSSIFYLHVENVVQYKEQWTSCSYSLAYIYDSCLTKQSPVVLCALKKTTIKHWIMHDCEFLHSAYKGEIPTFDKILKQTSIVATNN